MKAVSRVRAVGVVTLILAASGCGSARMTAETTRPVNSARNVSVGPAQRAATDATGHLASFRPPAGAVKERGRPAGTPSILDQPAMVAQIPDLVTRSGWWTVKGTPASVRSWLSANPPRGLTVQGSSTASARGQVESWTTDFVAPPEAGVLSSRELLVTVAALGADQTVIRVDAQDTWLPAKPSSERIPAAGVLTARATYRMHPMRGPDGSPAVRAPANGQGVRPPLHVPPVVAAANPLVTTVTDSGKIARIAALIDALQVVQPGPRNCPMDNGSGISLTFRSSVNGPIVAQVTASATGCRDVSVTVHGKPQPVLNGGSGLIKQINSVLGVTWPGLT